MDPGTLVADKYRIEARLGHGGMASVYRALHEALGQPVAIKVMTPTDVQGAVERFRREAQILARLRGEHVARAIDFGTLASGELYLVLEYLEGNDLSRVLGKGGPLPVETAVAYVLQACEGLAEAHAAGLVHRDIKPANLFLTTRPDGTALVKVLDFGIAKAAEARAIGRPGDEITATGMIIATANYASPEQLVATKYVGPATDQFSLAVTFYEMLTAERAFPGDAVPAMNAVLTGKLPNLREKLPDLPAPVAQVLIRALGKRPQDRFASIAELARALVPFGPADHAVHAERATRLLGEVGPSSSSVPVTAVMRASEPPLESAGSKPIAPSSYPAAPVSGPPASAGARSSSPYAQPPSTASATSSTGGRDVDARTSAWLSWPYVVGIAIVAIFAMLGLRRATRIDPGVEPAVSAAPVAATPPPPKPSVEAESLVPEGPFPPPGMDASPDPETWRPTLPEWCTKLGATRNKHYARDCRPAMPLEVAVRANDWSTVKAILLPRAKSLGCADLTTLKTACRATEDVCAKSVGQLRVDKGCH